jgi:hypothetical protein
MITEREAVQRALDLVRREKLGVSGVRSVRVDRAPEFLPEWAFRGDVWYVVFDLNIPPDRVISPEILVVIIDRETGETGLIELL